jgi:hypothetical protein
VDLDASAWSGDGALTQRLIEVLHAVPEVRFLRVEDAPASKADPAFSFISNELFVGFARRRNVKWMRRLGVIPWRTTWADPELTLTELEARFEAIPDVGEPDYFDESMLQYLRTERVIPPYQTRGYKLVELVRIYEAGTAPRREH